MRNNTVSCAAALAVSLAVGSAGAYEYIKSGWPVSSAVSTASSAPLATACVVPAVSGYVDPPAGLEIGFLRVDFSQPFDKWFKTTPVQGLFLLLR